MIVRKSKNQYRVDLGKVLPSPYTPAGIDEARQWCTETFGLGGRNKHCRWRYGWVYREADYFYFKEEKDALYFVLRWS